MWIVRLALHRPYMMGTASKQARGLAREISVNKLSVRNVEVFRAKGVSINITDPGMRGIIGENFLDHFDLLIDNEHRRLLFDEGDILDSSFEGEHLAMSQTSILDGDVINHRPVVYMTLPSYSSSSLRMLLDTGTNGLTLFPAAGRQRSVASTGTLMANVVGSGLSCETWSTKVLWGKLTLRDVQAASCKGASADKFDVEGNMPTYFFKRILISHAHSYVVANPERRSIGTSVTAAVRPQN